MRIRVPFVVFFGFLFFASASASALDLAVVGGVNFNHPSVNPDPLNGGSYTSRAAVDLGAVGAFRLSDDYQFETGLIHHSRDVTLGDSTGETESRYSGWLIPLTFRFMRAESFGLGFGPYLAFFGNHTKTTVKPHSGGGAEIDAVDPTRNGTEVGLRASLRIALPVYHEWKGILDASYLFGVTDLNKAETIETKTQEILLLVGVQIPFGSFGSAPRSRSTGDSGNSSTPTASEAPSTDPALTNGTPSSIADPAPVPSPKPTPSTRDTRKKKKEKRK